MYKRIIKNYCFWTLKILSRLYITAYIYIFFWRIVLRNSTLSSLPVRYFFISLVSGPHSSNMALRRLLSIFTEKSQIVLREKKKLGLLCYVLENDKDDGKLDVFCLWLIIWISGKFLHISVSFDGITQVKIILEISELKKYCHNMVW